MNSDLPTFRRVKRTYAAQLIQSALTGVKGSAMLELIEYDDHHFRVLFADHYFQLAAGNDRPSKSQWNTLKKKLKRRNRSVFVFRDHGELEQTSAGTAKRYYLDFGFMQM